jgi:hypothetical protein
MIAVVVVAILATTWITAKRSQEFRRRANFHAAAEAQQRYSYNLLRGYLASLEQDVEAKLAVLREHRHAYSEKSTGDQIIEVEEIRSNLRAVAEQIEYHAGLRTKYGGAAARPWLPVEADPPEPPWPNQGELPSFFDPMPAFR